MKKSPTARSSNGWKRSQTSNTKVELMFLKSSFIKREKLAKRKLTFFAFALATCLNQMTCGAGKDSWQHAVRADE
jgi:hypothetical protein